MFDIDWLPRMFCAVFAGCILSSNGSLAQFLTQNPLASPSTIGIQALAVLIYLIAFMVNYFIPEWEQSTVALILLHLTMVVLFVFGKRGLKKNLFKRVILFGLCINLMIAAIYSLLQFFLLNLGIPFPSELWFGSFKFASWSMVNYLGLILILLYGPLAIILVRKLKLLAISKSFSIGVKGSTEQSEFYAFLLMTYTTIFITLYFGVFSFVGLIMPHCLRSFSFMRKNLKNEVVLGGLISGVLFACFDYICYHFPVQGAEIPLGMLTSVIGPFVFLGILIFRKASNEHI